jgi:hypothetical protein
MRYNAAYAVCGISGDATPSERRIGKRSASQTAGQLNLMIQQTGGLACSKLISATGLSAPLRSPRPALHFGSQVSSLWAIKWHDRSAISILRTADRQFSEQTSRFRRSRLAVLRSLLDVYGTADGGGRFLGHPEQAFLSGFG